MLDDAARRRGGLARAARMTAEERSAASRFAALARWRWASTTTRTAVGRHLAYARRHRVPMMFHPNAFDIERYGCHVCVRGPAAAYLVHPMRTAVPPTLRCPRHAWAPPEAYLCAAYRRPGVEELVSLDRRRAVIKGVEAPNVRVASATSSFGTSSNS